MAERHHLVAGGDEIARLETGEGDRLADQLEELGNRGATAPLAGLGHVGRAAVNAVPHDIVCDQIEQRRNVSFRECGVRVLHDFGVLRLLHVASRGRILAACPRQWCSEFSERGWSDKARRPECREYLPGAATQPAGVARAKAAVQMTRTDHSSRSSPPTAIRYA